MLTPTKLALLIHSLECSELGRFYHDLYQSKEETDPLWVERHTSNSFIPVRAVEAPSALLPIIPDYACSAGLPIIPETMPAYKPHT